MRHLKPGFELTILRRLNAYINHSHSLKNEGDTNSYYTYELWASIRAASRGKAMLKTERKLNGRKINPNDIANQLERAMLSQIKAMVSGKLRGVRDPETGAAPTITVVGRSIDNLSFEVSGFGEAIHERLNASHSMLIVASKFDPASRRILVPVGRTWNRDQHGLFQCLRGRWTGMTHDRFPAGSKAVEERSERRVRAP